MADNMILEKLKGVKQRFDDVGLQLTDSAIISDMKKYVSLNREYKSLEPLIIAYKEYKNLIENINSTKDLLSTEKDEEMREMAKAELDDYYQKVNPLEEEIKLLLIPSDPEDDKNAILEIRAGTGGDEASIFAGDLLRMYSK
ncbi:MAG: PCRF domain-containing protein, partial [Bacteroidota bacterium]